MFLEVQTLRLVPTLSFSVSSDNNVAVGSGSLNPCTADQNTAVGSFSLGATTTGHSNTAVGAFSLSTNTNGSENTAVGYNTLNVCNGSRNTAIGCAALRSNTTGNDNVCIGSSSLAANVQGSGNTVIGVKSARNLVGGSGNAIIGLFSGESYGSTESNNVLINALGVSGDSNVTRIAEQALQQACYIAGIYGKTTAAPGIPVQIDSFGKLGTIVSSRRFKENITPVKEYNIRDLKVVNYNLIGQLEQQVGLIAEDVEQVIPELVVKDSNGSVLTIQYLSFIPILINHCQMLEARIAKLEQRTLT